MRGDGMGWDELVHMHMYGDVEIYIGGLWGAAGGMRRVEQMF